MCFKLVVKCYHCCNSIFITFSIWNLLKWLTLNNRYPNYQRMTWQGWYWIVKVNSIQCSKLKDDICELKTKFTALESELHVSKTVTDNLTKYIKTLEWKCSENEQYLRRESLEISGIPGSIADNALQETVLNLFGKCKATVDLSNVEDCHRLKLTNNAPQKVIGKLSKW